MNNTQQHISKSRQFQRTLYRAAKQSRTRRFHALYDRLYRPDILWRAWREVRTNKGKPGIDNESIDAIELSGVDAFLAGIVEDLKAKRYRPSPVRRAYVPKADGSQRPLGIPCVRDRVVQQACRIVIDPLFESLFEECSHGYRPKRSARKAAAKVREALVYGWWVVDADIRGFFDAVDHKTLLRLLSKRISDKRVLKLVRQWLTAGVIEDGRYSPTEKGTPQGSPISPLLANIYLHVLDRFWTTTHGQTGKMIRYCDDFVIICRSEYQARRALNAVKGLLERLSLLIHPVKTRVVKSDEEGFDFLGFHFRKCINRRSGKRVPFVWPGRKALSYIRGKIREASGPAQQREPIEEVVQRLNRVIVGWRNYFSYGNGSKQLQSLDHFKRMRLWRYFARKLGARARNVTQRFDQWFKGCGIEPFFRYGYAGRAL